MSKLHLLWTTDNKDTVFNMIAMYAVNSKKNQWWDELNVIVWGASAKLIGHDPQIQTEIREMLQAGVTIEACRNCCEHYGVTERLEELGITVRYMGEPLTTYLKNEEKILTL